MDYKYSEQTEQTFIQILKKKGYSGLLQLGKGAFGDVLQATRKQNEKIENVAIKVFLFFNNIKCIKLKNLQPPELLDYIKQEIVLMRELKGNQHIINHIDDFIVYDIQFIVMEFCETDLKQLVQRYQGERIPEQLTIIILKQILVGLQKLHEKNIIHRDLKLENILIKTNETEFERDGWLSKVELENIVRNSTFKLADLGQLQSDKYLLRISYDYGYLFARKYQIAPEIIEQQAYGLPADIFSLGVIIYLMLNGSYPYNLQFGQSMANIFSHQQLVFDKNLISEQMQQVVRKMLVRDPQKRIKLLEVYESDLFKSVQANPRIEEEFKTSSQFYFRKNLLQKKIKLINEESKQDFTTQTLKQETISQPSNEQLEQQSLRKDQKNQEWNLQVQQKKEIWKNLYEAYLIFAQYSEEIKKEKEFKKYLNFLRFTCLNMMNQVLNWQNNKLYATIDEALYEGYAQGFGQSCIIKLKKKSPDDSEIIEIVEEYKRVEDQIGKGYEEFDQTYKEFVQEIKIFFKNQRQIGSASEQQQLKETQLKQSFLRQLSEISFVNTKISQE